MARTPIDSHCDIILGRLHFLDKGNASETSNSKIIVVLNLSNIDEMKLGVLWNNGY